jgi:hypothetical protein
LPQGEKCSRPYLKNNQGKKDWGHGWVVDHLSSNCKNLSLNPRTSQKIYKGLEETLLRDFPGHLGDFHLPCSMPSY